MSIRVEHWSNTITDDVYEFISNMHCRVGEDTYEYTFELWADEQKILQNIDKITRIIANRIAMRIPNWRTLVTIQFNTLSNVNHIAKTIQDRVTAYLAIPRNVLLDPPVETVNIVDVTYNQLGESYKWHELMFRPRTTVQASITYTVFFKDSPTLLPTYRRNNRVACLFPTQDG